MYHSTTETESARLLHRRHLLLAGRLALRHVHLHVWWIGYRREVVVELSAGLDSAACEGPKGTTRDGVCVRTGTAGSSLLLILGWIVFTEVSFSRSGSGSAAGIFWCSGIIFAPAQED